MSKKSLILVIIQFSSFIYFGINGVGLAHGFWLFVQILGFIIGIWGVIAMRLTNFNIQPEVKKGAVFRQTGPYRWIRNPMYTGLILFFGSIIVTRYSLDYLIVYLFLVTSLVLKIFLEEKHLATRFGQDYLNYKAKTKRLVPFIF